MSVYALANIISNDLGVDISAAREVAGAAAELWDELAGLGWVDGFGGAESLRIIPLALSYIQHEANKGAAA